MKRHSSQSFDGGKTIKDEPHSAPMSKSKGISMFGGKSDKRRLAALKRWEKRRADKCIALSAPVKIVPSMDDDINTLDGRNASKDVQTKTDCCLPNAGVNSMSSGPGRKSNKRRLAALKRWEKRRKDRADLSLTRDASPSPAKIECNETLQEDQANATNEVVCVEEPSLKRRYTAELRSQASKAAWEKRRRKTKAAKKPSSNLVTDSASSEEATTTSNQVQTKSNTNAVRKRKSQKHGVQHCRELRRSRPRRTSQDSANAADTTKDANELITRLRFSRGWMEFHPSSRYGNGTADYAYIPGSLAQLIRNGAFSKPIVLENGTLGIHYALDYEGCGGLKAMIETFGEDYSPFPTEKMMEASREFQEKKDAKIEQWDIGDDLPWREVTLFDDEEMKKKCDKRRNELQEQANADPFSDMPDIEAVADILATLIEVRGTYLQRVNQVCDKCSTTMINDTKNECECPKHVALPNNTVKSKLASPALLALHCDGSDYDALDTMESSNHEVFKHNVDKVTCMASQDLIVNHSNNNSSVKRCDVELQKSFSNAPCSIFGIPLYPENEIVQHPKKQYQEKERLLLTPDSRSLIFNDWNFGLS
ncbi:hypothetical protein ACHAWX_006776 [Stephanocyclus meneghinianus]